MAKKTILLLNSTIKLVIIILYAYYYEHFRVKITKRCGRGQKSSNFSWINYFFLGVSRHFVIHLSEYDEKTDRGES